MQRFLGRTRYLILIPILGLALAAGAFFIFGGIKLIGVIIQGALNLFSGAATVHNAAEVPFAVQIVDFVHQFLIGTVLYITALGLYQLFIQELDLPHWLKVHNVEELETNLVGITVVVLAVQFMGLMFTQDPTGLMQYGVAIALPIAALALFIGLRTWSTVYAKQSRAMRGLDANAHDAEK